MSDLGELLKKLRGKRSLREASKLTGVSHNYLSIIERGSDPRTGTPVHPTPETLKKLAEAYDYPYRDLMITAGYLDDDGREYNETDTDLQMAILLTGMERNRRKIDDPDKKSELQGEIDEWKTLLNVDDLFSDLNLSDEELMNKYGFKYNGKSISKDKIKKILSYIRFVASEEDQ